MNNTERAIMQRVCMCVHEMATMMPPNPADLEAKLKNHAAMVMCCKHLYRCLTSINLREYEDADWHAGEAWNYVRQEGDTDR